MDPTLDTWSDAAIATRFESCKASPVMERGVASPNEERLGWWRWMAQHGDLADDTDPPTEGAVLLDGYDPSNEGPV